MPWYNFFCPPSKQQQKLLQSEQSLKRPMGMFIDQSNEIDMPTEYWKITSIKYVQQHWDKAFAQVQKIKARYLEIHHPQSINLISEINHLTCSNLYSLYLSGNNIISVQGLIFLNAPLLSDLDLRQNYITSIRSLKKCSFTLDHLFLDDNPLVEFQGLSQIKFNKIIKRIYVTNYSNYPGFSNTNTKQMLISCLSEFAKAEPKYVFQSLYIYNAIKLYSPINTLQRQKLQFVGI